MKQQDVQHFIKYSDKYVAFVRDIRHVIASGTSMTEVYNKLKKLGLKRGDLVAVMETPDGVFITPQQVVASKALDSIGDILKEQGLSLVELIDQGRDIRTDLLQETYGITETPKERLSR
jgi:hypothetical protein